VKVTVLYFAAVRDLVGKDEEILDVPASVTTIGALATHLAAVHAPLEGRLGYVRFARNEEFAQNDDALAEGDTIALIPPVAGG
jgi:molybdopterin synthase sulfur carrier subunit